MYNIFDYAMQMELEVAVITLDLSTKLSNVCPHLKKKETCFVFTDDLLLLQVLM